MSDSHPNVLLIVADQHRADCVGVYGNPYIQTPHLDQLAYAGARFSGAFSECPICIPARWCLMTGQGTYAHGLHRYANQPFPEGTTFLAGAFGDAGYQTQAVGKMHVTPQRFRVGFDHVLLNEEGRRESNLEYDDYELYLQERGLRQKLWSHGMPANSLHSRPASLPEEHISDMWCARECCRFLERRDPTVPFFLYASFRNPHPPLTPAQVYWDLYADKDVRRPVIGDWVGENEPVDLTFRRCSTNCDLQPEAEQIQSIRAYYGLISGIDNQIGMLLGNLRERGWLNDTIVLYTSDHGEMLFDHRLAHKSYFYQASCRVPMILSVPPRMRDRLPPGQVLRHPVMLQDVMPTLLDLAGVPLPESLTGESMARVWENPDAAWRECAFGNMNQQHFGITDNTYKYLYWVEGGVEQLFHVAEDPYETRDLSRDPAHAETLRAWRQRLVREMETHGDPNVKDGVLARQEPRHVDETRLRQNSSFNTRGIHW